MSILFRLEYEREEFCRFDDYGRYAKHLSRKLHTLRKSPEKKDDLLLFSAERVWANAMANKSANGKIQITLNKLRKACKHAEALRASLQTQPVADQLHALIYEDFLQASLSQERGAFDDAIPHYSRALVALQNQNSSLMEAVETGLRYSIYQSGIEERSINLQQYALEQLSSDAAHDEWRRLVEQVDPAALQEEKGEEMITSIQWASRSAQLKKPELIAAISNATSARAALGKDSTPNDFDSILAAWTSALTILASLLETEEDQNVSQDLELIKAWVSYHSACDRIARDLALIPTVSPREGILLCDAVHRTYAQILAIPGLDASQEKSNGMRRREIRGERCLLLAKTYGASLESIALINRAHSYFDEPSPRRREVVALLNQTNARYTLSANKKTHFNSKKWFSGNVKQLGDVDPTSLRTKSVTMKPVVFDIAWNYIVAQQGGQAIQVANVVDKAQHVAQQAYSGVAESISAASTTTPKKGLFGGLFGSGRS